MEAQSRSFFELGSSGVLRTLWRIAIVVALGAAVIYPLLG